MNSPPRPAATGVVGNDAEDMLDVVVEFASDVEETGSDSGAENDAVTVEFLTEHPDSG